MLEGMSDGPTNIFDPQDIQENKIMAGLAYILFFLPLISCKESKFGRFHANQGLVLLIVGVAGYIIISIISVILASISWMLYGISSLLYGAYGLLMLALAVYGLYNGFNGIGRRLPVIGKFDLLK
ncbi:MAG: hypothetical protein ACOX5F_00790 [Anaerovoracaceae bacterium]|jgi:uncharacterized membrane protein